MSFYTQRSDPVWYKTLLVVHVLAAIAWVGGGLTIQITDQLAFRRGGQPAVEWSRAQLAWADIWLTMKPRGPIR